MKVISLIFLVFLGSVSSQVMNFDFVSKLMGNQSNRLRSSFNNMGPMIMELGKEIPNRSSMRLRSSAKTVQNPKKKVKSASTKLTDALIEMLIFIESFQNVTELPVSDNSTTNCENINAKIIQIENNLRMYGAIKIQNDMTAILIQTVVKNVIDNYANNNENITMNITNVSAAGTAILKQIKTINEILKSIVITEKNAKTAFFTYRRGYCLCSAENSTSSFDTANNPKLLIETAYNLQKNDQAALKKAIENANVKSKATINLKCGTFIDYDLNRLSNHLTQYATVNDYIAESLKSSVCADYLTLMGITNYQTWLTNQTYKNCDRNLTMFNIVYSSLNGSIAASNSSLSSTQTTSLKELVIALDNVTKAFTKYFTDLQGSKSRFTMAFTNLQSSFNRLCYCKANPLAASTTKAITTSTKGTTTSLTNYSQSNTSSYGSTTTKRTTTAQTTSTTDARLSLCYKTYDIFGSSNNYLKSVCYVRSSCNYTQISLDLNMPLFAITTEEEYTGVLKLAYNVWGVPSNRTNVLRINGEYDSTDKKWYVYNPDKKDLYIKAVPFRTEYNYLRIIAGYNVAWHTEEVSNTKCTHSFYEFKK